MILFSDEPQPSSTTSQQFLCNIRVKKKAISSHFFAEHTAQKQKSPPVGSLIDPCHRAQLAPTRCTAVSPESVDTSRQRIQPAEEFQNPPVFMEDLMSWLRSGQECSAEGCD